MSVRLDDLHVALDGRPVLHGISATIGPGIVGVIGPNGAGKSTLLRAIAGLVPVAAGRVAFDGEGTGEGKAGRALAYLPQGQTIHWPVSVERLVALGRLPHLGPLSRLSATDQAAIDRALHRADLLALRDRPVTTLSGGERARALLARALAVEAPLLLADEPLAALDPHHQLQLQAILREEAARGRTILLVLHDLTTAARLCDRLLLLDRGMLVADGAPLDVLTPASIRNIYQVEAVILTICDGPIVLSVDRTASHP